MTQISFMPLGPRFFPIGIFVFLLCIGGSSLADDPFVRLTSEHCVECHSGSEDPDGDVSLDHLKLDDLSSDIELLQTLIDVLEFKEMPPADQPTVEQNLLDGVVKRLKQIRSDRVGRDRSNPHRTSIRRLNRHQYNNAVIDLFDLKCLVFTLPERMMREHKGYFKPASGKMPKVVSVGSRPLGKSQMIERRLAGVAAFPQDLRAEHGYDNQADHLSMSPLLMESFLKLGGSITDSPDFTPKNVGIWNEFFQAPKAEVDLESDVRTRMQVFLTRAFRGPVSDETLDRYSGYALQQLRQGRGFTAVMKSVASAVIAAPRFLYLYDDQAESATDQDRDLQLASRLSFFLWGSIPDQPHVA